MVSHSFNESLAERDSVGSTSEIPQPFEVVAISTDLVSVSIPEYPLSTQIAGNIQIIRNLLRIFTETDFASTDFVFHFCSRLLSDINTTTSKSFEGSLD